MKALNLHPKVSATLLATWITVIVAYSLNQWAGVDLPLPVGAAVTGFVAFVAGWLAPSAVSDDTPPAAPAPAPTA